jgi:glycosyltransferase involved in cell wall biosynthesis
LFDGATPPRSGPLRLAIISSYDEMCGIAGYTRALEHQLRPHADVTVFDLDQYLLRSPHRRIQRLADDHIAEIASRLPEFDSVNIQLEHGTLGRTPAQIVRRLSRLVKAAPAASITFHTMLGHEPLDWASVGHNLVNGRIFDMFRVISSHSRDRRLGGRVYRLLRSRQRMQPITCIVHTLRDARLLRDVFRIRSVDHHPLSFIAADRAERLRALATRDQFPVLKTLPPDTKLIGSFGFLSPYKGFETAIRALHYLPEDHHLLIFGGIHPQTIKRTQPLDPYIQTLLNEAHIGQNVLDKISENTRPQSLELGAASKELLDHHPEDMHRRVHFLGVHNDEGFMRAMAVCDVVVLPYLEVGQSSSGPIAMALEMGCRVLASRTLAFLQFARYHPGEIEFFDIGNFAELADLIRSGTVAPGIERQLHYNTQTNTSLYLKANQLRSGKSSKQGDRISEPADVLAEKVA